MADTKLESDLNQQPQHTPGPCRACGNTVYRRQQGAKWCSRCGERQVLKVCKHVPGTAGDSPARRREESITAATKGGK